MLTDFVGILPAGGLGMRLKPFRYPKELLPVVYEALEVSGSLRPRAVSEYALACFKDAGIRRCLVIIAPWKMAILDYFGDGSATGLDIGYLYQEEARGLPRALDLAYPWTHSAHVAFAMPDTIIRPGDCFVTLRERYETTGADLLLGVFPTGEPQRLGPVVIEDGKVKAVYDKCPEPPVRNTWGVALWGPAFSALMHEEVKRRVTSECEPVLGELFNLAVAAGLNVRAHFFPSGAYFDIGTPQGLRGCLDGLGIPRLEQLGP